MKYITLLLFIFTHLFAEEDELAAESFLMATMANDPSAIVDGKVNVITGNPCIASVDLVIQGAQPIPLTSYYIPEDSAEWNLVWDFAKAHKVPDASYRWVVCERGEYPIIYKIEGSVKIGQEKFIRYAPSKLNKGISNTASGKISSRTNPMNHIILVDEKYKCFTVHRADGTIRSYKKVYHSETDYKLLSEHLPNGNWIFYEYQEIPIDKKSFKTILSRIYTTNPSKEKIFASAEFHYSNPLESTSLKVFGSDGQTIIYGCAYNSSKEKYGPLSLVLSSQTADRSFKYTRYKNKAGEQERLSHLLFPLNREFKFKYYAEDEESLFGKQIKMDDSFGIDGRRNRVKTLSDGVQISHSFIYDLNREFREITSCYDSLGNYVEYHFSNDLRLWELNRYSKDKKLLNREECCWVEEKLKWRVFLDEKGAVLHSKRYVYDSIGNVLEERLYGNFSGKGPTPALNLHGDATNGAECWVKQCRFSHGRPSLLLEEKEDSGKRVAYDYLPGTDLVTSETTFDGEQFICRKSFEYNEDHILVKEIEEASEVSTIRRFTPLSSGPYIGMPHMVEELYSENGEEHLLKKTVLSYGTGGRIESQEVFDGEDRFRYRLATSYDEKGRVIEQTNALCQVEKFSYDKCGNRISSVGVSGKMTLRTEYDQVNRKVQERVKGEDGISLSSRFTYDGRHNLIAETDPRGNVTSHVYDAQNRRIQTILPENSTQRMGYDASGNEALRVDAMGNRTQTSFNAYGKPTLILHPDGAKEEFVYNLDGTLKARYDPLGVATHFEYDGLGRILSKKTLFLEERFEYRGLHLAAKIDAEGNRTDYSYDGAGRKVAEECRDERILYEYDSLGRVGRVQKGEIVQIAEYDLLDRVIEERVESENGRVFRWVRYEYDAAGNRSAVILSVAGEEAREESRFDSLNRLIEKKDPLGHRETFLYEDHQVLRKTHTDACGLETIETYDALNRLVSRELRRGKTLALEEKTYTPTGWLSSQIDTIFSPDGASRKVTTRWDYDSRGRKVALVEADGALESRTTRYHYTLRGELDQATRPSGITLDYRYDAFGRLSYLVSSDGTVHHALVYDRAGRLKILDGVERTFDAKGRILSEDFPSGLSLDNAYDSSGRRVRCEIPLIDCLIEYGYEGGDLKTVARKTEGGESLFTHTYLDYDLSGHCLEEELIGQKGRLARRVDLKGRTSKVEAPHFSQEILAFDPVGNIRQMRIQSDEMDYQYDDLYQLTSEKGHEYQYDSHYNRLEKDGANYEINALNQLVSHLEYDLNGNPTAQGNIRYTYDALDRLIRVETPECTQRYIYDFLHRCLSKTTRRGRLQTIRHFLYDGQNEIGSTDAEFQAVELRILGTAPHAEIGAAIAIELHGKVYVPIHDLQGNVAALLPLDPAPPTHYRYSAFGEEQGNDTIPNPWRFFSKRVDEETRLCYFGRRFYTPELGRWMTPDPAGFTDGMNLYAFVHNDPLTHFDEYGLEDLTYTSHPRIFPSLNPNSNSAPTYYLNGMWNQKIDCIQGAEALNRSLGGNANVIPAYTGTYGKFQDLSSVFKSRSTPDYSDDFIKDFKSTLLSDIKRMDEAKNPLKIFINSFSRGSAYVYHSIKDFTPEQKNRLMIYSCGGTMMLGRNMGFKVENFVSEGDWCCLHFHPELKKNPKAYDGWANVRILEQKDGFKGLNKDHFFLSQTYQGAIQYYETPQYKIYGEK